MQGLSWSNRLSLAWKSLTTPFTPEGGQAAQGLLAGLLRGSRGPTTERSSLELLSAFNSSPWVRACAARVADCKAATQWKLYVGKDKITGLARSDMAYAQKASSSERRLILKDLARTGELKPILNHLFLDLHSKNNDYFTGRDVRWLSSIWYDMIGDVFLIKERNQYGKAVSLWPVPPHWVANTPTPEHPFFRMAWRGYQTEIPALDMLWMQNSNPVNPYGRGSGLARSLDDEIASDEYASKHVAAHFKNSARPDMLVMPKEGGTFTSEARDRFEEFWNQELQGVWRRFKPLFLQTPVEVKVIEQNFRNLQLRELRDQDRDVIVQAWGIPPELFGIIDSSNRSTIDMAPFIFGTYVMVPRLDRERDCYQYRLLPEYDQRLILDYASPVPEDKAFKKDVMNAQPQFFYANEFRTLAGMDEDPAMDDLRVQPNTVSQLGDDGLPLQPVSNTAPNPNDPNAVDPAVDGMSNDDAKFWSAKVEALLQRSTP